MSIPSADSRSELCGTDTHCLRCVGCNRDFFSPVFRIGFEAPIHPPSGRMSGPSLTLNDHGLESIQLIPVEGQGANTVTTAATFTVQSTQLLAA